MGRSGKILLTALLFPLLAGAGEQRQYNLDGFYPQVLDYVNWL